MKTAITRGLAVVGAASLLVVGFDAATYAATGSSLLLGKANTAKSTTTINNTGTGAVLNLHTKTAATAPIVTNGTGLVKNLNAEKVGGNTAAALIAKSAPGSVVYSDSANRSSDTDYTDFSLPAGAYLMSFSANVDISAGTPAAPNEMVCYVYDVTTGKDLGEGSWLEIGQSWYASPSFSRVVKLSAAHTLRLRCFTDTSSGWNIPSDGFGPTLSFTKLGAVTTKALS
jgi:hypothetical protein